MIILTANTMKLRITRCSKTLMCLRSLRVFTTLLQTTPLFAHVIALSTPFSVGLILNYVPTTELAHSQVHVLFAKKLLSMTG